MIIDCSLLLYTDDSHPISCWSDENLFNLWIRPLERILLDLGVYLPIGVYLLIGCLMILHNCYYIFVVENIPLYLFGDQKVSFVV